MCQHPVRCIAYVPFGESATQLRKTDGVCYAARALGWVSHSGDTQMAAHDPVARHLTAQIAAHTMWAGVKDRTSRTAAMRAGLFARFEREVDPDGTLDPVERAKRVQNAMTAHYKRMALASAKSRRANAARKVVRTEPDAA